MPSNDVFFADQSEQSAVKAHIVSSYFSAWSRVIQKWNTPMAYIDLFCGPGKYENDKPSAPLLIVQNTLSNPALLHKMSFVFNDKDSNNTAMLQQSISQLDENAKLKGRLQFYNETVEQDFYSRLNIPANMPVLSFVDPFGYKGLTMNLINRLINNSGSDCIFFFNYNRINMALSSNTKFDEHLKSLFGDNRTAELKKQLAHQPPERREPIVLNALIDALRENKSNYVLPFKFYSTEMLRTSHFIIFVTKHPLACKIMKQIMYSNSAKDSDGVATFSFEDSRNFGAGFEQLTIFDRLIQSLRDDILRKYTGRTVSVGSICNDVDCDFSSHFVSKNVKDVLKELELEGKISVTTGRKQKYRNGKLNMPDGAVIQFE